MKTKMSEVKDERRFTSEQIQNWEDYESVRTVGAWNMFDPQAREATGLSRENYLFVMSHYSEMREQVEAES